MTDDSAALPSIIFDLDGTLININSIAHLIGDWDEFHEASLRCPMNEGVKNFALRMQKEYDIIIVTGKPERYRQGVTDLLALNGILPEAILMRGKNDVDSDTTLKVRLIEKELGANWRDRVAFAIEDRDKMVDTWRKEGITCLQCAPSLY